MYTAYLPNLALSDFHFFCSMKHLLKKVKNNNNLQNNLFYGFNQIVFYWNRIHILPKK